jgi:hypothetical protein
MKVFFCYKSFAIAVIFIVASVYMNFQIDKSSLTTNFMSILSDEQQQKYQKIRNERRNIYFKGFLYSFIFALVIVILKSYLLKNELITSNMINSILQSRLTIASFVSGVTLLITYFYYILSPKSDYMVLHLETDEQKKEWLNIYKNMQFTYHSGLLLGIIGMFFFGMIYC